MHCSAELHHFTAPRWLQTSTQHKQKKSKQEQSSVAKKKQGSCVKTSLSELLEIVHVSYDAASKGNTTFYYWTKNATVTGSSNLVRSNDHGLAVKEYASQ